MEITHVFRDESWLPSAPKHFLIYEAFGWEPPVFAHVSRVLGSDKAKLSKRHGAHSVLEYRDQGYVPGAVVNFLALLGWSLDDHTDIMSMETLVENFSVERLIPNPAVFNAEKLLWMNGMYIREMPDEELADAVLPFLERSLGHTADRGLLLRIVPLIKERIKLLSEIGEMADFFFTDGELEYDVETLLGKKYAGEPAAAKGALERVIAAAEGAADWPQGALEAAIRPLAEDLGVKAGDLFGLIRVAITGRTATPPLFETMEVLGREKTLWRLRTAVRRLG
jgi:glutamyl-tRNA synthetase